jgi:CheY-like chemotaxis protein
MEPDQEHGGAADPFVLILDDSASEGRTLTQLCRALGVRAASVDSTSHARAILQHLKPRAVITDIVMPGHTGFDVMRFVAAMDSDLPLMVASSSAEMLLEAAGEMQRRLQLRNIAFVRKPVGIADLRNFLADGGLLPAGADATNA